MTDGETLEPHALRNRDISKRGLARFSKFWPSNSLCLSKAAPKIQLTVSDRKAEPTRTSNCLFGGNSTSWNVQLFSNTH